MVEPIFRCELYDPSATFSRCTQCVQGFYLDMNKNECLLRKHSNNIEGCAK